MIDYLASQLKKDMHTGKDIADCNYLMFSPEDHEEAKRIVTDQSQHDTSSHVSDDVIYLKTTKPAMPRPQSAINNIINGRRFT